MIKKKGRIYFNWVLINQLAVGSFPKNEDDINLLLNNNINSILTLCNPIEGKVPDKFKEKFNCESFILPDHKSKRFPSKFEIVSALNLLEAMIQKGPVYVHCFAGVERSPLICIAYLMKNQNIDLQDALEYLMQTHPITNPLKGQLDIISQLN